MKARLIGFALRIWGLATFLGLAFLIEQRVDARAGQAMYMAFLPLVVWVGSHYLRCRFRRGFYGGAAMALFIGILSVYGLEVLHERAMVQSGEKIWTACFEDYMTRVYPGWTYGVDRPVYEVARDTPGEFQSALVTVGVRHHDFDFIVKGKIRQVEENGGWRDPTFTIARLDADGELVKTGQTVVKWPRVALK